jgi:hypothetical protein
MTDFKLDKTHSTTSFIEELKPSASFLRFCGMLKNPAEYDRDTSSAKFKNISRQLPALLLGVSAATK